MRLILFFLCLSSLSANESLNKIYEELEVVSFEKYSKKVHKLEVSALEVLTKMNKVCKDNEKSEIQNCLNAIKLKHVEFINKTIDSRKKYAEYLSKERIKNLDEIKEKQLKEIESLYNYKKSRRRKRR